MAGRTRGAASVEQIALVALVTGVLVAALAAIAAVPPEGDRALGEALARRLRCAAALPGPCWRDPLTAAYGRPVAGAVRGLAPSPQPVTGSGVALVPVDFRHCRRESCAVPGADPAHVTAANRRVTVFTSVDDRRPSESRIVVTYWLYRPTLGWTRVTRSVGSTRVAQLASTPLHDDADPKLVPLETLAGRNHYDFVPGEEPPWRWQVEPRYQ